MWAAVSGGFTSERLPESPGAIVWKQPFLVLDWQAMFQIIFNELSAAEISALPKSLQLDLLAEFQIMPADLNRLDPKRFGLIERQGKKLYRFRAKDYRIYFEKTNEGITVHRVLHKNTLRDFLFRSKLPTSEDAQLGETREFWKLIEQGERTRKT
ncbi:MAG: pare toxin of type ii toxin-antitoxin system parde [Spartobacteria bacterium]|nr:pare toxin of type ii toxin-antitoxin system parde [Spartobacteria bacterium]